MAETQTQQRERLNQKMARATWPEDVPVPTKKPRLQLSGRDGNVFFVIGRARSMASAADWTQQQIEAFTKLCMAGDYDFAIQTCMKFFDVK